MKNKNIYGRFLYLRKSRRYIKIKMSAIYFICFKIEIMRHKPVATLSRSHIDTSYVYEIPNVITAHTL